MAAESAGHRQPSGSRRRHACTGGSRSWIRWDAVRRQPSTVSVRLRAVAPSTRRTAAGGSRRWSRGGSEVGHLAWRYRPASTSAGAAVVLPGNQPPVPAENRVRRDDAGDLRQNPPAEFLASHRESTALGVGQAKWTWAKLLPEDPILLPEIIDHVFLVAVYPASGREYEEAQSAERRASPEATAGATTSPSLRKPRRSATALRERPQADVHAVWSSASSEPAATPSERCVVERAAVRNRQE